MSPEQAQGRIDLLCPASDVFSLSATLYHLLTGRPPYSGPNILLQSQQAEYPRPRTLARQLPPALEAICLKALAPNPADRYTTAKLLAQDIENYLGDEPVTALPESLYARLGRWTRRNRHWVQAGGVALVLVALTAIGAYFYQKETAEQNLQLAEEKSQLADEMTDLATKESQVR